jgi:ferredoxin
VYPPLAQFYAGDKSSNRRIPSDGEYSISIGFLRGGTPSMTHVVTEKCVNCKYTDCVVVCPVECFYQGEKMLYIHPDECIDCEACVPECPVEAIFLDENVPDEFKHYIEINAEMAPQSPQIVEKQDPLEAEGCVGLEQ